MDAHRVAQLVRTISYGYDATGRLTQEKRESRETARTSGAASEDTQMTGWEYDAVGNRLKETRNFYNGLGQAATFTNTSSHEYSYNGNDWLQSSTSISGNSRNTTSYSYDDNGSQIGVTSNVGGANEATTPYAYDFEGHLRAIGSAGGAGSRSYSYDAEGNRLSSTVNNQTAQGVVAKNTLYLNDTNTAYAQVLEERDGEGTLEARYSYGDEMGPLAMVRPATQSTPNSVSYYLGDGLESTRQLVDPQGNVTDSYSYDAFGGSAGKIGSTINTVLFNGQQQDGSGLTFLRARYYNAGTGRFLSHDPLLGDEDDPTSQHRYLYAGSDPVNATDPSGQFTLVESLVVAAIVVPLASVAIVSNLTTTLNNDAGYNMKVNDLLNEPYRSTIIGAANGSNLQPLFLASIIAYEINDLNRIDRAGDVLGQSFGRDSSIGIAQVTYRTASRVHPNWTRDDFLLNALDRLSSIKLAAQILRFEASNPRPNLVKLAGGSRGVYFQDTFVSFSKLAQNGNSWSLDARRMMAYVYTQGWQWSDVIKEKGRVDFFINPDGEGYGVDITDDFMERPEFVATFGR